MNLTDVITEKGMGSGAVGGALVYTRVTADTIMESGKNYYIEGNGEAIDFTLPLEATLGSSVEIAVGEDSAGFRVLSNANVAEHYLTGLGVSPLKSISNVFVLATSTTHSLTKSKLLCTEIDNEFTVFTDAVFDAAASDELYVRHFPFDSLSAGNPLTYDVVENVQATASNASRMYSAGSYVAFTNGFDDHMTFQDQAGWADNLVANDFTINIRWYIENHTKLNYYQPVLVLPDSSQGLDDRDSISAYGSGFELAFARDGEGAMRVETRSFQGASMSQVYSVGDSVVQNTWYNLTVRRKDGDLSLYVNGNEVSYGGRLNFSSPFTVTGSNFRIYSPDNLFNFGYRYDDLKMYNFAMSSELIGSTF